MKKTTVLVADDHKIVRFGLSKLISMQRDLVCVGEAEDGASAVSEALRLKPDVVIMDLMMPGMDGAEATAELHRKLPSAAIIILTSYSTSDVIHRALEAGATGAMLKTTGDDALLTAIRTVAAGKPFISTEVRRLLDSDPPISKLTDRQVEVLRSLTRGLSNKEIAKQLGISSYRIQDHVNALLEKIGAANRVEAVAIALKKHLLKI